MHTVTRREMLKLLGLGVTGGILAACGPQPTTAPAAESPEPTATAAAEPTATPAPTPTLPPTALPPTAEIPTSETLEGFVPKRTNPPEKVKLVYWWGNNYEPATEPTHKLIARFSIAYPNVEIESVAGQNCDAFVTAAAAGTPPDLFHTWDCVERMGTWAKRKMVVPLDDYIASDQFDLNDYIPGIMDTCKMDGKIWGMVDSGGLFLVWSRPQHFTEIGKNPTDFPADTDELWDWANKLTTKDADGNIQRIGLRFPSWSWPRLAWLVNFGAAFWDTEKGEPTPDHPGALEGLNDLVAQVKLYGVETLDRWSTGIGSQGGEQSPFLAGTETMEVEGDWQYAFVRDFHADWQVDKDYGLAAPPSPPEAKRHGENAVAYWSWPWVVPAGKQVDWGWELLRFFLSTEYQLNVHTKYFTEMVSRKSLMFDERVVYPPSKIGRDLVTSGHKFTAVFPMNPVAGEYNNLLGEAFDRILHLTETPEEAMARVKEETLAKLKETMGS